MTRKERQQSGSVCTLHVRYESKTCPHDLGYLRKMITFARSISELYIYVLIKGFSTGYETYYRTKDRQCHI